MATATGSLIDQRAPRRRAAVPAAQIRSRAEHRHGRPMRKMHQILLLCVRNMIHAHRAERQAKLRKTGRGAFGQIDFYAESGSPRGFKHAAGIIQFEAAGAGTDPDKTSQPQPGD